MTTSTLNKLLHTPIVDMPEWSKGFAKRCHACGLTNLQDIVQLGTHEVSKPRYLGPIYFRELVDYLQAQQLLLLLNRPVYPPASPSTC